jgi:DNA ligase-1
VCQPKALGFAADLGFRPSAPPWVASFRLSERLRAESWEQYAELRRSARERFAEGFMLKRLASEYPVGRKRGFWWKWKVDPLTVDAVVMYAQRGSGRRASLYSDYTFGLWDGGKLVPFAKAYSGLSDEEMRKVDAWVRAHTRERFGPVRTVDPVLVMELAFEGIQLSNRHKSGLAVRFPRIVRWRQDKPPEEADSLQTVKDLLERTSGTRRSSP